MFIVADPAAGEYTVPEAGKYYAEIKGTDTFTITKTLDVSGTFPLYQYPPRDGTTVEFNDEHTVNSGIRGRYRVQRTGTDNIKHVQSPIRLPNYHIPF